MMSLTPRATPPVVPSPWLLTRPRRFNDLGAWSDSVNQHFVPLEIKARDAGPFCNLAANETLGCLQVSELVTAAQSVRRTRMLANQSEVAQYKLSIQVSGRSQIAQDGRSAVLHPGDWGFYDTSRPYEVQVDSGAHFLVLRIPSSALAVWETTLQARVATCFGSTSGSARVAVDALRSLVLQGQALPTAQAEQISTTVMQLFALSLGGVANPVPDASLDAVREGQLRVILRHVHEHLSDDSLTVAGLAAQFRMSRRYLYKLFSLRGLSPADYILGARLERCRDLLSDPASTRQISELAHMHGFVDASAFSHAFRRRFGLSPSEWRASELRKTVP
ncbi:helix-turn-helix domain-containing protein [Castellaniella caeni]|uniref:helix-turn-helix domain-containing protein n=1 Tax=Castellaniella caeni TaxID=266123 RepID=UPI001E630660|nr:helix-turn-helix domain-containing protein [Castellaniella caeni]